jgi:acetylornithine deacetylase
MTSGITSDWVADLASVLVRHPSEQSAAMEADPAVIALIDDVAGPWLERAGIVFSRDPMGNLVVNLQGEQGGPHLMFMGYAMTHPAAAMKAPFSGEIISLGGQRRVRGRGASEQKGALAAGLTALQAFTQRGGPVRGRLSFALSTAGETGRHDTARSVVAQMGAVPDYTVILLGTDGRISIGNKGRIDVALTVRGRSCHSSTPSQGVDAISGARVVMALLDALRVVDRPAPDAFGPRTLTVTAIESFPKATHTVQDRVEMMVDWRLLPGDDPEAALEEIRHALSDLKPWSVGISPGPMMYPALVNDTDGLVSAIRAAMEMASQPVPDTFFSPAALDAGFFLAEGGQAVMWGPGQMEQFHSDEEAIEIEELALGARGYLALMEYLLGTR